MTTRIDIKDNTAQTGSTQINNVNLTTAYAREDIDRFCLRALRCPDSLVVKNRLKENKDKLLPQSIEWILQDPQYESWQNGDDVCLLWIKGGAGKGKTMISIGIVEELSRPQLESTVVTYFFCQNADYELNTLEAIIKGLILQLVNQQPVLKQSLRRRWDSTNNRFDEDVTSWRTLWNIFLEMLDWCKCQRVYMIVDALDECQDNGMADFLKLIVRNGLDHPAKIKWMLTSRPLDSAERELLTGHDQVQVSLELNSKYVSEAVKTYIASKVDELNRRHKYGAILKRELETELTEKAEGTFLWVSLVCKKLESVCRDKALTTIQNLPLGLHPFYDRIFDQLSTGERANVQGCMRLLKVMMLVYRPLKVEEVGSVTGLTDEEDAIRALADRCASFIKMQENKIAFVHQSARDYLAGENGQSMLDAHDHFGHHEIALGCLSYLSKWLKVNLIELPRPDSTRESLKTVTDQKRNVLLASVDYAATFWVQHLEDSKRTTIVPCGLTEKAAVGRFLCTKFLEWLECLSLLDRLPRAIEALKTLAKVAKDNYFALIHVQDGTRFLLRHYHTMVNWPLQIYSSAVIFSPESSIVKRENTDKIPRWLRNIPPMEDTWACLIQTLAGDSGAVMAVAFSPDGKQIACGSDNGPKLWDATTGDLQKTLAGHSRPVSAVAFSPDGKHIASGSDNGTVSLWDATTGDLQKTLAGYGGLVHTVAFSPDGKHIASGSDDRTVKLWDATTGNPQKTLAGHSDSVYTVAFSPDGKHIASGSYNGTVKLWDATTGNLQKTLAGQSGLVDTVSFSLDGKQIASGFNDGTVELWDATTGNLQNTLAGGQSGWVDAVAFSPDGKQIASGFDDGTVELWDATTGDLQKTLARHSSTVTAVAFSPDGKQIASGSLDCTVKLWDATTGDLQKTPAGHSHWVNTVAFSPDGKQIASGSYDGVKLWDATTGDLQKSPLGHSDWVNTVAFSPDGKHIASGSNDRTVQVCDTTTGDLQKSLAGHRGAVMAVAFSPDGKHIASGSDDGTVKLWDATTGDLQKTLRHSPSVFTVAFSPDGKQIASGSYDGLKLWDATTADLQKTLAGHSGPVSAVAFSSDGKHIASGSDNGTVSLWANAKSLKATKHLGRTFSSYFQLRSWQGIRTSAEEIVTVKFSADNRHLVTNSGPIRLVNTPADGKNTTILESFQDIYIRNQWICYAEMPFLRLPSHFKPMRHDVQGDQVTIGFENGRVLSFDIDRHSLQSILRYR